MIASEISPKDISEAILTSLAPCESNVKFRHTLLVLKLRGTLTIGSRKPTPLH